MARLLGLGHVGIYVRDLERMVAFYRDVMGMRVTKQNWRAGVVFLSADPEELSSTFKRIGLDLPVQRSDQARLHAQRFAGGTRFFQFRAQFSFANNFSRSFF